MGPHHPATHGVLRLLVTLEGEVVRDLKPIIGYLHTGIEKTAEDKSYWKAIPVIERMDYLAYYFNAMAFCGAVETLLDLEVPKRAQYLRVIHLELNRIMSHLVWLGTSALDLGAISMFWYCFRDREQILDLFEMSSGQRMHTRYIQVGGVFEDIPLGFEAKLREFLDGFGDRVDQYAALLNKNEIVLQRLRHVCPLDEQTLLGLGVTGPLLRAAGNPWDLRKAMPYSSYDDFEFRIPVGTIGDNYDRYLVRLQEMRESTEDHPTRRSTACPRARRSPTTARSRCPRATSSPPRWRRSSTTSSSSPRASACRRARSTTRSSRPRGELACFVRSDGSSKPARVHMRDPSFVNLQATAPMTRDAYIADLIATLAMLDPILGGVDR